MQFIAEYESLKNEKETTLWASFRSMIKLLAKRVIPTPRSIFVKWYSLWGYRYKKQESYEIDLKIYNHFLELDLIIRRINM